MHIVISGSSPDISREKSSVFFYHAREAQPGRAELWRCLGYKFKSYLEHLKCVCARSNLYTLICLYLYCKKGSDGIGRHE